MMLSCQSRAGLDFAESNRIQSKLILNENNWIHNEIIFSSQRITTHVDFTNGAAPQPTHGGQEGGRHDSNGLDAHIILILEKLWKIKYNIF